MSAPDTPAPYAPQPLDAAEGHGNPPSQAAPESTTRRGLLDKLTARLTGLYDAREARSIALIALAELAGLPLSALLTDPGAPMAADGFEAMAAQLAAGRPVQYVVGHTEFYGHRFAVREGVLIPRPETEELVSWVVHDERRARALLDVGTGSGFAGARMRGSQNNDPLLDVEGTTATNNAGGINGGITNGNEIVVRAAVKPTPSIGREQNTYNLATDKVEPLTIRGRHDVCVALRGAVVVEAAVAIALANFIRH